jgi:hypothetical protein
MVGFSRPSIVCVVEIFTTAGNSLSARLAKLSGAVFPWAVPMAANAIIAESKNAAIMSRWRRRPPEKTTAFANIFRTSLTLLNNAAEYLKITSISELSN